MGPSRMRLRTPAFFAPLSPPFAKGGAAGPGILARAVAGSCRWIPAPAFPAGMPEIVRWRFSLRLACGRLGLCIRLRCRRSLKTRRSARPGSMLHIVAERLPTAALLLFCVIAIAPGRLLPYGAWAGLLLRRRSFLRARAGTSLKADPPRTSAGRSRPRERGNSIPTGFIPAIEQSVLTVRRAGGISACGGGSRPRPLLFAVNNQSHLNLRAQCSCVRATVFPVFPLGMKWSLLSIAMAQALLSCRKAFPY